MAKIYAEDGTLDYAKAAQSLVAVQQMTNSTMRGDATELATAAALLDIAVSLNAIVGQFAPVEFIDQDDADREMIRNDARKVGPDGELLGEEERQDDGTEDAPFDYGDRIQYEADDDRDGAAGVITAFGMSEGSVVAHVHWDGQPEGETQPVWLDDLRREVISAPDATVDENDEPIEHLTREAGLVDDEDDVDADFEPTSSLVKVKKGKKGKNR